MAAKFFTGLPLDGPDPECVLGHGEAALAARARSTSCPRSPPLDHSQGRRPARTGAATRTRRPVSTSWHSLSSAASRVPDGEHREWFESVAEAQRRAKQRLPQVGLRGAPRRRRARRDAATTTSARSRELGFVPRIAAGLPAERETGHDGDGPGRRRCR